jgi:hypothetical protein
MKNSWKKIESEEDLPKEICSCWVANKDKVINTMVTYNPFEKGLFSDGKISVNYTHFTHYMIINKPNPPVA